MSNYDHGPIDTFEIVWRSGHIEQIQAHQVLMPPDDHLPFPLGGGLYTQTETQTRPRRGWAFHGEVDGHWRLILSADAEDIRTVRNVTHTNDRVGGES
ncbi:hypothetical protein [Nocardia aurea]|uniref:hypothetical protein n=1 Tax=Nocardia aurea TaxID=2144174 RepID=UPI0033B71A19